MKLFFPYKLMAFVVLLAPKTGHCLSDKDAFGSKSLKCLVCRAMVEEIRTAIESVDPRRRVEIAGYHFDGEGATQKKLVPYGRSEGHLNDVLEELCPIFEDYAQALDRASGRPTIVRLADARGGMNPNLGAVELVPDEDLNTRLKFYCEAIREEHEDLFLRVWASPLGAESVAICQTGSGLCPAPGQCGDEL